MLRNIVDLTFLLLAVLLITILLRDMKVSDNNNNVQLNIEALRLEVTKVMSTNIQYMEGRVNKLGETQDTYQVSTTHKINLLEQKVEKLEKDNKNTNRIINNITNNNTNIVNGKVADEAKNNNK